MDRSRRNTHIPRLSPRRTRRQSKPSLKALENASVSISKIIDLDSTEESDEYAPVDIEKPSVLHENDAVYGEKLFAFQTRKKRDDVLNKAMEVNQASAVVIPKTPHAVRNKIKKNITINLKGENSSDDEDLSFSDSGSEFVATDKESSESEEESSESDALVSEVEKAAQRSSQRLTRNVQKLKEPIKNVGMSRSQRTSESAASVSEVEETAQRPVRKVQKLKEPIKNVGRSSSQRTSESDASLTEDKEAAQGSVRKVQKLKEPIKNVGRSRSQRTNNKKYVLNVEDYFKSQSTKKIVTSNHTLDKLETPRLPQDQLHQLLSKLKLPKQHAKGVEGLVASSTANFNKWMYLLHENFNIIVYGLGSKKKILQQFHESLLKDLPVVVINGFFPSLTIKDFLDAILVDLLESKQVPANPYEACEIIENECSHIPDTHLYIIFHNIEHLRAGKSQNVLARLAAVRNIHFVVSIDHINAPLIWDHSKLSKFNFSWWDITSFNPYLDETSFESSMMVQKSGSLALSSLRNVFLSLTSNSKGIYLILVEYQLKNEKSQYYQGLAFKELYSSCREAFLVSSDLALRAQLTEFIDHKMVKVKRSHDGTENLIIPISNSVLQQFLSEQS